MSDHIASPPAIGIAQEPDGIRLGGRRVLSIDGLKAAHLASPEPAVARCIDWKALAAGLGLSALETRLFLLHWSKGIPISRLPGRLKISAHAASKLYASVRAKLGIAGQTVTGCLSLEPVSDSLRLVHKERLPSGLQVSSLARLDHTFLEVMREENYFSLISQRDPGEFQKPARICAGVVEPIIKGVSMSLEEKLKLESAKLGRIGERLHAGRIALETAQADLNNARVELDGEMSASVLEDRLANTEGMQKKVQKLQTVLDSKRSELSGAETAHRQQAGVVQTLEDQRLAGLRSAVIAEVRPEIAQYVALQNQLGQLAFDIQGKLTKHGNQHVQVGELFETGEHPDTLNARFMKLFAEANFYSGTLTIFNPKLRGELCRRYPNRVPENWERSA
jgi:hypothetical protein